MREKTVLPNGYVVSTVFTDDDSANPFETLVFANAQSRIEIDGRKYPNERAAQRGHAEHVVSYMAKRAAPNDDADNFENSPTHFAGKCPCCQR